MTRPGDLDCHGGDALAPNAAECATETCLYCGRELHNCCCDPLLDDGTANGYDSDGWEASPPTQHWPDDEAYRPWRVTR